MTRRWVVLSIALWMGGAASCGMTAGREATFRMVVEAASEEAFETDDGWQVVLERAELDIRAIYLENHGSEFTARSRPVLDWLIPKAYAHETHDEAGAVVGEHVEPLRVNLLEHAESLGEHQGTVGPVDAFTVLLGRPELAEVAWVAGQATRNGETVRFEGALALTKGAHREFADIETRGRIENGAVFVLRVDFVEWLRGVDFQALDSGANGIALIAVDTEAHSSWKTGLRRSGAFQGVWRTP